MSLLSEIKLNARNRNSNAAATMGLMLRSIVHAQGPSGDWTNIAWIIGLAEGSDRGRLTLIAEAACGCVVKTDKKSPSGIRVAMPKADSNVRGNLPLFEQYVDAGYSFRSKALSDGFGDVPALLVKEEKVRTYGMIADSLVKQMDKLASDGEVDLTDGQIIQYVRDAIARRNEAAIAA